MAVAVEIGRHQPEAGSPLRLGRQRDRLHPVFKVQEKHRAELNNFQHGGLMQQFAKHLLDGTSPNMREAAHPLSDKRHRRTQNPIAPFRLPAAVAAHRLDGIGDPVAIHVAVVDSDRAGFAWFASPVEAPVCRDDIDPPVVVEVPGGDAVPPTGMGRQAYRGSQLTGMPTALLPTEHPERVPMQREDQLRPPIPSEVAEHRALHHAKRWPAMGGVQLAVPVFEQNRVRGGGIAAGEDSSAHEHIEVAVTVEIDLAHRPDTPRLAGRKSGGLTFCKIIDHPRRQLGRAGLIIGHSHEQRRAGLACCERQKHGLVPVCPFQDGRSDRLE